MSGFTPSPAELALVTQLFAKADPQKIGILTGDAALKVFGGAKLTPIVLGEIWSIADEENNGWLSRKGVAIAVRLMGWAQKGEKVQQSLINKPGPLPVIEGIQAPLVQQSTGMSIPKSPPPGLPLLTPQDKAKFMNIFQGCKPINGLLTGEQARDVFVKSKLPVDKLGQIWSLADTQDRGALDSTDFAIGMYLIQASMSGQLSFIPTSLPPGLYEQASGGVTSHTTGSMAPISPNLTGSFNSRMGLQQQYTGQTLQSQTTGQQKRAPPVLPSRKPTAPAPAPTPAVSAFGSTASPFQPSQPAWDVTPAEKASADRFFETLDTQKAGYIEGEVAVPFMIQSNLPEDVLAQVWDLADMNNDGRLTRDGFAVAMHLIQGKLAGKEIPASLPQSLIPPSMRSNFSQNTSPFQAPPQSQQDSIADLLWDDTPPPSASPPPIQQQPSGFAPSVVPPPQPQSPAQDPFGSTPSRNFLDDDEPAAPLQDQSAEIGNVQNQLNSTNRSLSTAKAEREPVEQSLASQAAQLSALQTQLSSAKAAYETETKLLSTLRDRANAQTAEINKTREELIRAESDLSGVRVEKAEVEGGFLRDKEDVRELHRRMAETGTEVAGLKLEIEKAKKEAKQQKGLLAIAKKQLSTKEAEKAKYQKELEEAQVEVTEADTELKAAELELEKSKEAPLAMQNGHEFVDPTAPKSLEAEPAAAALTQPLPASLPVSPDLASPAASMKSNNPFDKLNRSASASSTPRSQSPFLPFAQAASIATPPTAAPTETIDPSADPFGLSDSFTEEPQATAPAAKEIDSDAAEPGSVTPRPDEAALAIPASSSEENPISPGSASGSEFFSTPPSTAAPLSSQSSTTKNHISDVTSDESHFPALDDVVPGAFPTFDSQQAETETDLGAPLKEIEVDDSDSDSDEEPLSNLKHKLQSSTDTKDAPANGIAMPSSSFDDAFSDATSIQTPKPSATTPSDSLSSSAISEQLSTDPFGAPLGKSTNPFPVANASSPPQVAGLSAFDEAMGKIPGGGEPSPAANFSFDSAFEDNFDFASASSSAPAFPPAPSAVNGNGKAPSSPLSTTKSGFDSAFGGATNGTPTLPSASQTKPFSFDDAFAGGSPNTTSTSQQAPSLPATKPSNDFSFDDAFGGVDASKALKLDSQYGSTSSKASAATSTTSQGQSVNAFRPSPGPQTPPISPKGGPSSPRISSIRSSTPPPRGMSPPPRHASPGPRPSTGSSKDGHEKPAPATRTSRLSIRLPFGKKKKHDAVPPPVPSSQLQQFLSPAVEEPSGPTTPAVDDDVDSVKQLCGMGFSRTQAVTALEKHGYDVQKALNSLLGAQ